MSFHELGEDCAAEAGASKKVVTSPSSLFFMYFFFFYFALFIFTFFFLLFTWLSSIIFSSLPCALFRLTVPFTLLSAPCLVGRLFLGCWSSFLCVEHCSPEEAVGGPSCCPSWVSACARLVLPHVTQVSLTPAPTHLLTFSCQFWDGATGLSLFKDMR